MKKEERITEFEINCLLFVESYSEIGFALASLTHFHGSFFFFFSVQQQTQISLNHCLYTIWTVITKPAERFFFFFFKKSFMFC